METSNLKITTPRRVASVLLVTPLLLLCGGCGLIFGGNRPSEANIVLRKENQTLRDKVKTLQQQHETDVKALHAEREHTPGLATLSADRLDRLYTVHGLQVGRLTGPVPGGRPDGAAAGLKVYVVPTDASGEPLKAAGTFTVEAFDLADRDRPRIGVWPFDAAASRAAWNGAFLEYTYVLRCPWQQPPEHEVITLRISFVDELTGGVFHTQSEVHVTPAPPTTSPAATSEPVTKATAGPAPSPDAPKTAP